MTANASTQGLIDTTAPASTLQQIQWAIAAGTSDAIIAAYPVEVDELVDGLCLGFRVLTANLTTTPTFAPDQQPAYVIVKGAGSPMGIGDFAGNGQEVLVRLNLAQRLWYWVNR